MKKSIISVLLMLAMLFTVVSCKKDSESDMMMDGGDPENMADASLVAGTEDYGKLVENEFILTEEENVSTFSADVDTASYTYFRKLVNSGYSLSELISTAGSSIRTEEMINYFDYGYQSPTSTDLFSVSAQIADCPWNKDSKLMVLGLQTSEVTAAQKNNLVFLIDVSGSMNSEDKLGLLKESFSYLVSNLDDNDTVSIVTYSGSEKVVLDGCAGSKKDKIIDAVNSLEAGGSTNGESGLKKAYAIAEKHYISDGNNRIIMASDGDLNVGISSVEELEAFVTEKRESGVFMSVLGFGTGNYRDSQMETIADCGNGVYYYIDCETEAEKVFGEELFSTLYTVAKDVKLQLTFNQASIQAYRLVGYENRILNKEDFENDTKDAGDLGAGHSVTVCYELIFNDGAFESDAEWMNLAVRYKAPDTDKSELNEYKIGKEVYTDTPDKNFRFICCVAETSMIIHESKFIGYIGLEDIKEDLGAIDLTGDAYKLQFVELIDKLISNK